MTSGRTLEQYVVIKVLEWQSSSLATITSPKQDHGEDNDLNVVVISSHQRDNDKNITKNSEA